MASFFCSALDAPEGALGSSLTPLELRHWLVTMGNGAAVARARLRESDRALADATLELVARMAGPCSALLELRAGMVAPRWDTPALVRTASDAVDGLERMWALLMLEELATEEHLASFDAFFVSLNNVVRQGEQRYRATLHIAGAAEKRPALVLGDLLRLRSAAADAPVELRARVVSVRGTSVEVAWTLSVPVPMPSRVHVRFVWSERTRFRRMYAALGAFHQQRVPAAALFDPAALMAAVDTTAKRVLIGDFPVFDERLSSEQKAAVAALLGMPAGGPYLLLEGSAGSGKTETIVEMVRQALRAWGPDTRVLVCAPSNGAADVLALRLQAAGVDKLLRLHAHHRHTREVLGRGALDPVSRRSRNGFHELPERTLLRAKRVVVATCATSGWLFDARRRVDLFKPTLIIIDEAAQAIAAEQLVPLALATPSTRVVLCGDVKQLGPTVRSSDALRLGLGETLLDRLARHAFYCSSSGAGRALRVTLTRNYRCHPELMAFSSRLFYDGAVSACLNPIEANSLLSFEDVNGDAGFPAAFYGCLGIDEHDGDSPSFWNTREALEVARVVERLLCSSALGQRVRASEIVSVCLFVVFITHYWQGVVTPFYAQVRLIRAVLRERGLGVVRVGSVEDYQGQEEKVLVVSAVRSSHRWLAHDAQRGLGLVHNARLFNVCITRAKCLLLLVGNPHVLSVDPNWRELLAHIIASGCYHGCAFDPAANPAWPLAEVAALAQLEGEGGSSASFATLGFDSPWDMGL